MKNAIIMYCYKKVNYNKKNDKKMYLVQKGKIKCKMQIKYTCFQNIKT